MTMQLDMFALEKRQPPQGVEVEEWRIIPGFERYEASSNGRFRNAQTGKLMSQQKEINGYPIVQLTKDGKQHAKLAHRMVCIAFHGEPPSQGAMVNHINRIKDDNRASNLEWTTRSGNASHWWDIKRGIASKV